MNLRKLRKGKSSRLGVSEVMGAVLMMAVTLAVGFAVWFWATGAASTAETNFGSQVNSNVNCLKVNFVIINANFSSTNPSTVTLWFYNLANNTEISLSSVSISGNSSTTLVYATNLLKPSTVTPVTLSTGSYQFYATKMYDFVATASNSTVDCSVYSPTYSQITPNPV